MFYEIVTRTIFILIILVVFEQHQQVCGAHLQKRQGNVTTTVSTPGPVSSSSTTLGTPSPSASSTPGTPSPSASSTPGTPSPSASSTPGTPSPSASTTASSASSTPTTFGSSTDASSSLPPGTNPHQADAEKAAKKIIELSQSTDEGDKCNNVQETHVTLAIEALKIQNWTTAMTTLKLVQEEYDKHVDITATAFKFCDRALFHTCHPVKEICGCDVYHKSTSAGQKELIGHRYIWKHHIRSFYCYAASGSCTLDPTTDILSIFPDDYDKVYGHYGDPKNPDHKNEDNCLYNLCVAESSESTACMPDPRYNTSIPHFKPKSTKVKGKSFNRNIMQGRSFNANNMNQQGRYPNNNGHQQGANSYTPSAPRSNGAADNPKLYQEYIQNLQNKNPNGGNGIQGGNSNKMGQQRKGQMNNQRVNQGGPPNKMNQMSGNSMKPQGRNLINSMGPEVGHYENNQRNQQKGPPNNNIERPVGYSSNNNNMNQQQQQNRINDFIL